MFIFALEAAAERSYPTSKARGGSRGQGQWLGGATGGAVAAQAQEGLEELSHVEGQERGSKEIPLV